MRPCAALERLYERHADRLLTFFVRRTADPQIAADLWAETFAQTVAGQRRRSALSGDADRDASFLYTVAHRQLALYYRRGYAEQRAMTKLGLERPELAADPAARLDELAELEEIRTTVDGAVGQLSAGLGDAVRLRIVDGHTYAEVAERLAISEQAARARVSRGLRALAGLLTHLDPTTSAAAGQEHA